MLLNINDFSVQASRWVRTIYETGESILVTRRNKEALARLVPFRQRSDAPAYRVAMRDLSRKTFEVFAAVRDTGGAVVTNRGEPVLEIIPLTEEEQQAFAAAAAANSREFMASLAQADEDLHAGRARMLDDAFIDSLPDTGPEGAQAPPAKARRGSRRSARKSAV